jgi:hypothetical protein
MATMPGAKPQDSNGLMDFFGAFNFGNGGMFNGFNQAAVPGAAQGQASGGFNSVPGMPTGPMSSTSGVPGGGNPFPANNTTAFGGSFFGGSGTSGVPGGNSGFPGFPQVQGSVFKDLYGHGVGDALQQFLNSGAGFNKNVVNAEMNAAMPLEARGIENIMNAMGGHGLSGSSTAAVGVGDFETQFNAQLENMFAQQYEQSVQRYIDILTGTKQDAKENNAQQGNWMSMLSGIASAAIPFFG